MARDELLFVRGLGVSTGSNVTCWLVALGPSAAGGNCDCNCNTPYSAVFLTLTARGARGPLIFLLRFHVWRWPKSPVF